MIERQSCEPFLNGFDKNPDGGHDDHGAFKSGGEKCDALKSVEERRSRGLGAQAHAERRECHGNDVHHGFGEIGKNCGGSGDVAGNRLSRQHHYADC